MLIVELFWVHDFHVQVQPFSAEEDAEDWRARGYQGYQGIRGRVTLRCFMSRAESWCKSCRMIDLSPPAAQAITNGDANLQ